MLEATVRLLLKHPPADITVHMIANEAGVHHDYIARYFTSREELLIQVTEIPVSGMTDLSKYAERETFLASLSTSSTAFELAKVRNNLIAYLFSCGVDPERFAGTQQSLIENTMLLFTNPDLSERSKRNFALMGLLMMQSMAVMGEVNGMSQQDKDDITSFIVSLGPIAMTVQDSLGWDKPRKPEPKKRTQSHLLMS
jgi:AcrR family transcriptional regulator